MEPERSLEAKEKLVEILAFQAAHPNVPRFGA